ncbi:MAG: relaxase/mobilization nuclease domain-containing protein [Ruminococcus sp.]|nr:relaxase/mobilization nuclease domain-containing protein [Ruminococcus sp.]
MAILKHVKSKNANYSSVIDYLLYQHNEKNSKPILDEYGRKLLREDFYMDGINCSPLSFDKECRRTNTKFHKNNKKSDIKNHHYIISFDPDDVKENNLTGEKAQQLCLEYAKKNFPGYQALVVTHADGDNHSGNIHTHIVINSVRKYSVEKQPYMDKPHEEMAGYKHRSTKRFLTHLKKEVMEMCQREGLHQIDLLAPAKEKTSEKEYRAKTRGQKRLEQVNQKILDAGMKPTASTFQTQKDFIRNAISEISKTARTFDQFQSLLLDRYNISVTSERGRYRYLHPDRDRRITDKALGSHYGKDYLEQKFLQNQGLAVSRKENQKDASATIDYRKDPIAIFRYRSSLRLVVNLQDNVKAMQNEAYAQKVKISNLQQMAETLVYVQEHGYGHREEVVAALERSKKDLETSVSQTEVFSSQMKTLNSQIHYTGQYYASKNTYRDYLKTINKKKFRQTHETKIQQYLEARDWLKEFYRDGKILSLKSLQEAKESLKTETRSLKEKIQQERTSVRELETVLHNIDAILNREEMFIHQHPEKSQEHTNNNYTQKQKEETL